MENVKEKIGWGILGPGRIAHQFCDCLEELPDAYVAAVGSRSLARSREFTEIYGGKPYGSYQEMLSDPDVDIVYVATPHQCMKNMLLWLRTRVRPSCAKSRLP